MKDLIVQWAYIAILVGMAGGFILVLVLWIFGINKNVNSLLKAEDLVGRQCTVEIPFDEKSRGKIRVSLRGVTMDLAAATQEKTRFERGEKAVILGRENNKVWVVSESYLGDNLDK